LQAILGSGGKLGKQLTEFHRYGNQGWLRSYDEAGKFSQLSAPLCSFDQKRYRFDMGGLSEEIHRLNLLQAV
jgi:hypothetical protein